MSRVGILRLCVLAAGWGAVVAVAAITGRGDDQRVFDGTPSVESSMEGLPPRDTTLRVIARSAPFRVTREPALVRFDSRPSFAVPTSEPAPAKPLLTLAGIVEGAAPRALIRGLPGTPVARLMSVGDTQGGLRVRSIRNGIVRVAGLDTTWALSMERTP